MLDRLNLKMETNNDKMPGLNELRKKIDNGFAEWTPLDKLLLETAMQLMLHEMDQSEIAWSIPAPPSQYTPQ